MADNFEKLKDETILNVAKNSFEATFSCSRKQDAKASLVAELQHLYPDCEIKNNKSNCCFYEPSNETFCCKPNYICAQQQNIVVIISDAELNQMTKDLIEFFALAVTITQEQDKED